jgi:protein-S-isoprenylcysteine O-methyltransferase Ste14
MEKRLSRFGVGPRVIVPAIVFAILAGAATRAWPEICTLQSAPHGVFRALGAILVCLGILMWAVAVISVMRAYNHDQLLTSGVFALCRHPVYAAWIVFIFPGLALLTRSWPLMLTPFVAYAVFKTLIHVEDEYLQQRFGKAYMEYRARVNTVVPLPKF